MKTHTLVVFKRSARTFRWRLLAKNARIIAASSEAYQNKADCYANIRAVLGINVPVQEADTVRLQVELGSREGRVIA